VALWLAREVVRLNFGRWVPLGLLLTAACGIFAPDESSLPIAVPECVHCPEGGGGFEIAAHYETPGKHHVKFGKFTGVQPGDTVHLHGFPHPRPFIYYELRGIPPCDVSGQQYYHSTRVYATRGTPPRRVSGVRNSPQSEFR